MRWREAEGLCSWLYPRLGEYLQAGVSWSVLGCGVSQGTAWARGSAGDALLDAMEGAHSSTRSRLVNRQGIPKQLIRLLCLLMCLDPVLPCVPVTELMCAAS